MGAQVAARSCVVLSLLLASVFFLLGAMAAADATEPQEKKQKVEPAVDGAKDEEKGVATDVVVERIHTAFGAELGEKNRSAYADWAATYDTDLNSIGYHTPFVTADVLSRHLGELKQGDAALQILDAGAGTGFVGEQLTKNGFGGRLIAMDYSESMLDPLRKKGKYASVMQHDLNQPIPLENGSCDAVICAGTLYQNQVQPLPALAEFLRVARVGGLICFSLRLNIADTEGYEEQMGKFVSEGRCEVVEKHGPFHGISSEPDVCHKAFVYRTLKAA